LKEIIRDYKRKFEKAVLRKNIETRYLWKPMHLQPLFKKYKFFGSNVCGMLLRMVYVCRQELI
jgi:hypothetical protein